MNDERGRRIEDKIDKVVEDMTEVKVTLAKQHVVLVEHESRSTKLEAIVLPIHRKVTMIEGVFKFIGFLATIAAVVRLVQFLIGK